MKKYQYTNFIIIAIIFLVSILAAEESPLKVIKESNRQVLELLSKHKTFDKKTELELFKIISEVTDFSQISQQVVQPFRKKLTAKQYQTFNRVFQRLLQLSSIKKMGRYRADRFQYLEEKRNDGKALVKTIAYFKDDFVALDYHLEIKHNKWLIVNYVADDVDTIRNYQKQFLRLFAKKTFNQIIDRLLKKISQYESEYIEKN